MNKEIEDIKRRAGIITEDVVPFKRPEQPKAEPVEPVIDPVASRDKRIQAMAQLSEVLAEELWEVRQDKKAVKKHLKNVIDNLVMSVMYRFRDEG